MSSINLEPLLCARDGPCHKGLVVLMTSAPGHSRPQRCPASSVPGIYTSGARSSSLNRLNVATGGLMDLPTKVVDTGDAPSEPSAAHVHVVDDDPSVRTAIVRLLKAEGYLATAHRSAEAFLAPERAARARLPHSRFRHAGARWPGAAARARRARQPHADHLPDRPGGRADVRTGHETGRLRLPDQAGRRFGFARSGSRRARHRPACSAWLATSERRPRRCSLP